MRVLKRNAIRCLLCGDVVESKLVHDFQQCRCGACFCDGGHEYVRIGGDPNNIELLLEYEDVPGHHIIRYDIFGNNYTFDTTKDIQPLIDCYENNDYYVIVEDEEHNEIYRTKGIDRILAAAQRYEALIPDDKKGDSVEN